MRYSSSDKIPIFYMINNFQICHDSIFFPLSTWDTILKVDITNAIVKET